MNLHVMNFQAINARTKGFLVSIGLHASLLVLFIGLAAGPGPKGVRSLSLDITIGMESAAAPPSAALSPKPLKKKAPVPSEPVMKAEEPVLQSAAEMEQPSLTESDVSGPVSNEDASSAVQGAPALDLSGLRERVQRSISYPSLARRMGWEGRVVVSFTICPDGSIKDVKIVESSGKPILDSNALDVVKRIDRFPTGGRISGDGEKVVLPIVYRLDG
jgi:protein TonB